MYHKSVESVPQEWPTRVADKSVLHECPSDAKSVRQGCPDKGVPQDCPLEVSYKSVPQQCPARMSDEVPDKECPTRVSHKTRVSYKSVPQESPTRVLHRSGNL